MNPHLIYFYVFEDALMLDISGPLQVLKSAINRADKTPFYDLRFCSATGGTVRTDVGIGIETIPVHAIPDQQIDTVFVTGGISIFKTYQAPEEVAAVKRLVSLSKRVCSVCTGAFMLAQAGLLEGRNAVTHWRRCSRLRREFPNIVIREDAIFVQDGPIWTSAGVTTGIDLALALVEADLGREAALAIAQELVVFMKRPGGQQQYSALLKVQIEDRKGEFDRLHQWVLENLSASLNVLDLANITGMSSRTFTRRYKQATGMGPAEALERFRLEAAAQLLMETDLPMKRIADRSGFGQYERMRRAFLKIFGVSPKLYRERFQS
ncbi:GlxA family transcriptional regulator [Sneathiella aquimaris]|uniref:GlxA family transcriptional regulator n=1 Tax=Sneathiella aquimaris TaxID=2599305 RepID=UPI00146A3067|nr:GlxA family transcriptional regulator [Sneathiella aquimaris]